MKFRTVLFVSGICFLASLLVFALNKSWIIINYHQEQDFIEPATSKKNIKIYYWKHDKWYQEETEIIWNNQYSALNAEQLVKAWLSILDEEKIIHKKIVAQYVLLEDYDLYLSLDSSLFDTELSVQEKLKIIESLFKTTNRLLPGIKIYFLVHNEPMHDYHLDFSNAWRADFFEN